jgi:hypothetical protein
MPIRLTVDHLNRVVLGVGDGVLTIEDLVAFGLEVLKAKVLHYGKIIDVATCEPGFSAIELSAFAQIAREQAANSQRGPLALVVDPNRGDLARLFAGLDLEGRPANVFRSIHDARQWLARMLAEHQAVEPPTPTRPARQ